MAMNWKVAAAGGAVLGLGVGGFVLTNDDGGSEFQQIRDVDLQSARDSISSMSSPIRLTPPTTVAPAPSVDSASVSADTPAPPVTARPTPPPPAPAPAPVPNQSFSSDSPVQPGSFESASSFSADSFSGASS